MINKAFAKVQAIIIKILVGHKANTINKGFAKVQAIIIKILVGHNANMINKAFAKESLFDKERRTIRSKPLNKTKRFRRFCY